MSTGDFHWFTALWTVLALPIRNAEQPVIAVLQGYVTGWFQVAVAAYLVSLMLIAAWSADESSGLRFFRQLFLAGAVFALAATSTAFSTWVTGLANGIVTGVTNAMSGVFGGTAVTSANAFDGAANSLLAVGIVVLSHVPKYSWVMGVLLGLFCDLYMIVSVVIIGWLFLLFLLSDVILGFVISFGPLFIACYLFPFTRAFFDGWVRAVVAALLVKIFITALMTLFTVVMMTFVGTVTGTFSTTKGSGAVPGDIATEVVNLVALAAVCSLFGFVGFEMSKLAQSIAGGAHAQFQKLPSLPRFGSNRESESSISSGGGTQRQIAGPASGAGAEPPPRQFAFDHTVGSADP